MKKAIKEEYAVLKPYVNYKKFRPLAEENLTRILTQEDKNKLNETYNIYNETLKINDSVDFYQSAEYEAVVDKIYEETVKIFKESYPDEYEIMVDENGGSLEGLDAYPLFDTVMDGVGDDFQDMLNSAKQEFKMLHPQPKGLEEAIMKSHEEFRNLCRAVSYKLLEEHGNNSIMPDKRSLTEALTDILFNMVNEWCQKI